MISEQNELDILEIQRPIEIQAEHQVESILDKIDQVTNNHNLKQNALEYDIRLGWLPRSQITGPIPLSFSHYLYDQVIIKKVKSLIYQGYRPSDTFQLHSKYYDAGNNYPFYQFHLCKAQFLKRFFKKYYSDYDFTGNRQAQMIEQDSPLIFDSCFETGNLDAVYYQQNEYRLLLRVDSNTIGHCNYYNFKITVKKPGRYIFRIMNINKEKSLYERGMKPYVRWLKKFQWTQFLQCKNPVKFLPSSLNQEFQLTRKLFSLKFQYEFLKETTYQFSYTIPFGYSDLLRVIKQNRSNPYMHVGKLCHTLSGIEIPLLTITKNDRDYNEQDKNKKNLPYLVLITGRVHPSEVNSSHIVNGLLKGLMDQSAESRFLRSKVIFKIIPMINPDGVIIGNTRTSFAGKDLNRKYHKSKNQVVFPETIGIMDYVHKLKAKYKENFIFVIDIHGHSTRKNSFFYGPEYSIMDQQFSKCRLLPKYMSQRTDIFRYFLCKFKVNNIKAHTARGYFNSMGVRTYTHETSMHCFFNFKKRQDQPFTRSNLEQLGNNLNQSIFDYVRYVVSGTKDPKLEQQLKSISVKRVKGVDYNAEEEDSQVISSDKADSEEEADDIQQKKLLQFYSTINQNKYYFYQELSAQQNIAEEFDPRIKPPTQKQDKKGRKSDLNSSKNEEHTPKSELILRMKLQEELIEKKTKGDKIDWVSKAVYPSKKRKSHHEYPKLANVIFGSSIPSSFFTTERRHQNEPKRTQQYYENQLNSSRYSIRYIEAQFKATSIKYPSPQPKIYKSLKPSNVLKDKSLKRETSDKFLVYTTQQKDKQLKKQKLEILLELKKVKENHKVSSKEITNFYTGPIQRMTRYESIKAIPICSVDLVQNKEKQKMRLTNSLKVLTRKKSIKSIHQSKEMMTIKATKNMKSSSLPKKLPSLYSKITKN